MANALQRCNVSLLVNWGFAVGSVGLMFLNPPPNSARISAVVGTGIQTFKADEGAFKKSQLSQIAWVHHIENRPIVTVKPEPKKKKLLVCSLLGQGLLLFLRVWKLSIRLDIIIFALACTCLIVCKC